MKPWCFRKKLEETEKQFYGHNENRKKAQEKINFLLRPFILFSRMPSIRLAAFAAVPVGDMLHRHTA